MNICRSHSEEKAYENIKNESGSEQKLLLYSFSPPLPPSSPNSPIPFGICWFRLFLWQLPQTEVRIISVPIENTRKCTASRELILFFEHRAGAFHFISYS